MPLSYQVSMLFALPLADMVSNLYVMHLIIDVFCFSLAHMLTKMPHAHILNMGAEESSSDDSDIGGVFGFSEDDCFELACQGIKPWDPEAGAALAVLNGYYDDF